MEIIVGKWFPPFFSFWNMQSWKAGSPGKEASRGRLLVLSSPSELSHKWICWTANCILWCKSAPCTDLNNSLVLCVHVCVRVCVWCALYILLLPKCSSSSGDGMPRRTNVIFVFNGRLIWRCGAGCHLTETVARSFSHLRSTTAALSLFWANANHYERN